VTFHDPCHLSRHQKLSLQARKILRSLPGIEFIEMREADWCCGGAGAFALEHPNLSLQILERKVRNIEQSGADIVATTCPSCMMQLRSGLIRAENGATRQVQVMHVVDLLRKVISPSQ
jgi:glycolate oxidase iron-sulfur subunit